MYIILTLFSTFYHINSVVKKFILTSHSYIEYRVKQMEDLEGGSAWGPWFPIKLFFIHYKQPKIKLNEHYTTCACVTVFF